MHWIRHFWIIAAAAVSGLVPFPSNAALPPVKQVESPSSECPRIGVPSHPSMERDLLSKLLSNVDHSYVKRVQQFADLAQT
jgi:hypothetical protein